MKTSRKYVTLAFLILCSLGLTAQQTVPPPGVKNAAKESKGTLKIVSVSDTIPVIHKSSLTNTTDVKNSKTTTESNGQPKTSAKVYSQNTLNALSGTQDAGNNNGELSVSLTGGATYKYDIDVPPGIRNIVPNISIVYNSQGGPGLAGYGWNISGLSSITRIPSTKFHDNKIAGVSFGTDDRFALDGQRLILKSGTYGGDGAEYQTENYSNLKIHSRGVSPYGTQYGPEYFEVFYPDGTIARYGNTIDSRSKAEYYITYSEDALGARINYYYTVGKNVNYINTISYGSLSSSPQLNTINFVYQNAARLEDYLIDINLQRDKILSEINIIANGTAYRNYELSHETSHANYQRLTSIVPYNGDKSKYLEPINFGYDNSEVGVLNYSSTSITPLSGLTAPNTKTLTTDYTGEGQIDMVIKPNNDPNIYMLINPSAGNSLLAWQYAGYFADFHPGKFLNSQNKLTSAEGMVLIKEIDDETIRFDVCNFVPSGAGFGVSYSKEWSYAPSTSYYSSCSNELKPGTLIPRAYFSGDFNGDGMTEIISVSKPYNQNYDYEIPDCDGGPILGRQTADSTQAQRIPPPPPEDQCCLTTSYYYNFSYVTYIDLDRRVTSYPITYSGGLVQSYEANDRIITADFNGDGKTDFAHIKQGVIYVYSFDDTHTLTLLWQTNDSNINPGFEMVLGDYNGDGKTDMIFAQPLLGVNKFLTVVSKGNGFVLGSRDMPFTTTLPSRNNNTVHSGKRLISSDINHDGKSDIVIIETHTNDNQTQGLLTIDTYYHNGMMLTQSGGKPEFVYGGTYSSNFINLVHDPAVLVLNSEESNHELQLNLLSDHTVHNFNFIKDVKKETRLKSITEGGLNYSIYYQPLSSAASDPSNSDYPQSAAYYEQSTDQVYPNIDIEFAPGLYVVSKLRRMVSGTNPIWQTFNYGKAVTNVEGLGFLGFQKFCRSNWHKEDNSDNQLLFTTSIFDPNIRGSMIKQFTSKSKYINPSIINAVNGSSDGASINDYVTRTDNNYTTSLQVNKVYTSKIVSIANKNILTSTNTTQTLSYDAFNNTSEAITSYSNAGTETTQYSYDNNNSAPGYYIGRVLTFKKILNNGIDTRSTEKNYTYTGFLPTQIKTKGTGTGWMTEDREYDNYGNITRKTITTPSNASRSVGITYETSGRFPVTIEDADLMESSATYSPSTGDIITKTNPYNQTETRVYDSWGRLVQTTDYLSNSSYRNYYVQPDGYSIWESDDENRGRGVYINSLGDTTQSIQINVLGSAVGIAYNYDAYGRGIGKSEIGPAGTYNQWNTSEFDEYGRLNKTTTYSGKVTNITYNGLSVTSNDGYKSITTTRDAIGNIIQLQDPGGTVNYTYYADGSLKTSNINGIAQNLEYDGWGRKTKLDDPSAGQYLYDYTEFGEIKKETTPTGETNFTYDPAGKLISKTISGLGSVPTSMSYNYTYKPLTKQLEQLTFSNLDGNSATYTNTYDTNNRLSTSTENNTNAIFTKTFTYDSFGRLSAEEYHATNKSNSRTAARTIEYIYQFGELLESKDQATGASLSKINTLTPDGQILTELQGSSLKTTYAYDTYGLPQTVSTERLTGSPGLLMSLGYSFDAAKGVLSSRSNSSFGTNEYFQHDNLNRLTNISGSYGTSSQSYDPTGKIYNNSLIGNYVYESSSYRQTEINSLTSTADAFYQTHTPQTITYTAFKRPIKITETGVEIIDFQYNAAMQRAHMFFGSQDPNPATRPMHRHYSEDGSMEITENLVTGETSFVFYLGGDAYSAPAIYKDVQNGSTTLQNIYFLRRDHLGSIMLLADINGAAVEKRTFDAWGNIINLTDGNGTPKSFAAMVIDRGYTGHEHLFEVGIINMNGRLYDPRIHRFLSPDNFIQDPLNSQSYNRFGYALNNPLYNTDPNGEFIPVLVFVGAAILGGGSNVWSNWSKIVKNPWSGVAYFASGAAGGAVSVVNPLLGGTITAAGNVATDVAYGNIPKFNGIGDVAKYIGGVALDGFSAAGAGSIAKFGYQVAGKFGWVQSSFTRDYVGAAIKNTAEASKVILTKEVVITAAKTPVAAIAETAGNIAAKGSKTFFEGAKYSDKVIKQMGNVEDVLHAFPKSVDGFASKFGEWTTKVGGDGKLYQWLKIEGTYGGKVGVFEYTKDANGIINHRFLNILSLK